MATTTFNRVCMIIGEQLHIDPEKVTMNDRFRGNRLKADSLDLINLVMAFATEFGVEIQDNEIQHIDTVGDVVQYLGKHANP